MDNKGAVIGTYRTERKPRRHVSIHLPDLAILGR